jgi:hypothetical protein
MTRAVLDCMGCKGSRVQISAPRPFKSVGYDAVSFAKTQLRYTQLVSSLTARALGRASPLALLAPTCAREPIRFDSLMGSARTACDVLRFLQVACGPNNVASDRLRGDSRKVTNGLLARPITTSPRAPVRTAARRWTRRRRESFRSRGQTRPKHSRSPRLRTSLTVTAIDGLFLVFHGRVRAHTFVKVRTYL